MGVTDNVLEVGGGFFIKIKKHKEFYDFEEVIQVIDGQNERNVKRMKLDKEDKALLRPLLAAMLKKKTKQLTPEQQLIGAVLSILMKKARVVMEIRAENEILVDRILDIIREERGYAPGDEVPEENETEPTPPAASTSTPPPVAPEAPAEHAQATENTDDSATVAEAASASEAISNATVIEPEEEE